MSTGVKFGIAAVIAILGSDFVVKTFTGIGDLDNEKMAWRLGSGFAIGMAAAKLL